MFDRDSFMQTVLRQTGAAPSRRAVKNRSGRTGRKQYSAQVTLAKVGGFADLTKAVYAPADTEMCRVVDSRVGWTKDGKPFRSPGLR